MCAVFKLKGVEFKPGREVSAIGPSGSVKAIWAGFARSEILDWWISKGGVLLDIPCDEFAERSEVDGSLNWKNAPPGQVLRALLDRQTNHALVKIVTREATREEFEFFQHSRVPVFENPLHEAGAPAEPCVAQAPLISVTQTPKPVKPVTRRPAPKPVAVQELLFDF
jgi:hypothetical protein